ncbi:site-specific integrase [uncultured Paraglaciecola sp.]|uniref:tyrosine-type recombinase/integrase n=1 Tax=uncultured Paraglaciecola sp. TaxID=1765024 RepID=UPI002597F5AF|nr:site-specific integrase [uncultured Paraglaciecola sp.]
MTNSIVTQIIKSEVNLGKLPYFANNTDGQILERKCDEFDLRDLRYHSNDVVKDFPLIFCSERIKECLEFNLFLIDRKTGAFALKRNRHSETEQYVWSRGYLGAKKGQELDVKSITPIAKDLRRFLDWIVDNDVGYEEVLAVPNNYDPNSVTEAEGLLPVWRFQQFLTNQVKKKQLSYSVATRVLRNIRAFYLWNFRRGEVNALPFTHKLKAIKIKRKDDAESIFSMPGIKPEHHRAQREYISNLTIPKSAIQKRDKPNKGLLAYSGPELKLLMTTDIYAHRTYGLFIKCALFAGLRAFEIVQINKGELIDPTTNRVSFSLSLLRKFSKATNLRISPKLMQMLWVYSQDPIYLERQRKHEEKYGINNPDYLLPLFLNRNGERMSDDSVKNTIQKVRAELKARGLPRLDRDFHDLRATFATYWAIALIKKGYSPNDIKAKLILLMSHETFDTTQRYIDFAIEGRVGTHGAMQAWVVDIYQEVMNRVEQ